MKIQKWLILLMVLALIAVTGGALTWLKRHQKLGQPGIKAAPIPGSVAMKIDLPAQVLDFTSTNVPESDVELGYFPKDTSFVERWYTSPDDSPGISATVILMGADRTSIHRPEYCLVGQGFTCDQKEVADIPVGGVTPYRLPVAKWKVSRLVQQPDGQNVKISGVYVFWFVADNEHTTGIVPFQCYLVRDLLLKGNFTALGVCFVFFRMFAGAGRSDVRANAETDCGLGAGISVAAPNCNCRSARVKGPLQRTKKIAKLTLWSN